MNCARRTSSRSSKPRLHSQAPGVVDISHLIKDINGEHTRDGGLTRVAQKCHITKESTARWIHSQCKEHCCVRSAVDTLPHKGIRCSK